MAAGAWLAGIPVRRAVARHLRGSLPVDRLVERARTGPDARDAVLRELERRARGGLDLPRTRRAIDALALLGAEPALVVSLCRRAAREWPSSAHPLARQVPPLVATDRVRTVATLLEAVMDDKDLTGVDLDWVLAGALLPVSRDLAVRTLRWAAARPGLAGEVDPVRLSALVDDLLDDARAPEEVVDAWAHGLDDERLALQVVIALRERRPLPGLVRRLGVEDLGDRQLHRAAESLWRAGEVELAVDCARRVQHRSGGLGRRARDMLGEHESMTTMGSGWSLPAPPADPGHRPVARSVVHVVQNSLPHRVTGSANRTHGLLSALVEHGWTINAITPPGFPFDDVEPGAPVEARHALDGVAYHHLLEGGAVLPVHPMPAYVAAFADGIEDLARKHSAAVVHTASNAHNALAGATAARRLGLPNVYEVRGLNEEMRRSRQPDHGDTPQYRFARSMEMRAAQEADRVIAITTGLRDILVARGLDPEKVEVVPNAVDTRRFVPAERDRVLERRYGLEGRIVLGYVGSLNWYEGLPLLLRAVARLRHRHPDVRVLIVGDGRQAGPLRALRAELGLEDVVVMTGSVPFEEVEAHYSLIDVAPITRVSSPVTETVSPLKPFEAMAMGKALVASDVAVLAEFVEDDVNGLLFRKDDVDSLEAVLHRLLGDEALRRRLAESGREWVVAERDWRVVAARVTALYASLGAS